MKRKSYKSELIKAQQTIITLQRAIVRLATIATLLQTSCKAMASRATEAERRTSTAIMEANTIKARLEEIKAQNKALLRLMPKLSKPTILQVNQN